MIDNKVIFIDWGIFIFGAIYGMKKNPIKPTYTAMSMLLSNLKLLGITPNDIIIIACDSPRGSWRKEIDSNYKANRRETREKYDIDWKKQFKDFDNLFDNLKIATPFYPIRIDKLEADDIIAYGVRFFKDKECIIVSCDSDYEQLAIFTNVKIFSNRSKQFKIIKNPKKSLERKIIKEKSDNLNTTPITKKEIEKRRLIVDLTTLPSEVEFAIKKILEKVDNKKKYNLSKLRFANIRKNFMDIYNNKKTVTIQTTLKRKYRKEKKKQKLKNTQTKLEL